MPGVIDDGRGVGPIDGDGDASRRQHHDDDKGIEPVVDVGDAEALADDDGPLVDDG